MGISSLIDVTGACTRASLINYLVDITDRPTDSRICPSSIGHGGTSTLFNMMALPAS